MTVLSPDEITARLEAARARPEPQAGPSRYRYVKPFSSAAEGLIETAQNSDGRFMFGMTDLDMMMRGVGKGDLCYVTGRPHSGKTQVVLNAVAYNFDRPVLWFTPDEVAELVLMKLVALQHGIDSETLEARVKGYDQEAIRLVRQTAAEDFANLIVVDDSLALGKMNVAYQEAVDLWQEKPAAVVVDFLEIVPGEGSDAEGVVAKSEQIKGWGKEIDCPLIVLRQSKRTGSSRGQAAGMEGMRYGGEDVATFVVEVYRKRDDDSMDAWERQAHENTVTVNLSKNKRPPCKKGEADLFLDPNVGTIRPLVDADFKPRFEPIVSAPVNQPDVGYQVADDYLRPRLI